MHRGSVGAGYGAIASPDCPAEAVEEMEDTGQRARSRDTFVMNLRYRNIYDGQISFLKWRGMFRGIT